MSPFFVLVEGQFSLGRTRYDKLIEVLFNLDFTNTLQ